MNWRSDLAKLQIRLCIFASIGCIFASFGCNTAVPVSTEAKQPSFDAGVQNSGFLGWSTNAATGQISGMLTSHARDRYNALILAYGKRFAPPLSVDEGLSYIMPTNAVETDPDAAMLKQAWSPFWLIDSEHLVKFQTMNRWRKEAK